MREVVGSAVAGLRRGAAGFVEQELDLRQRRQALIRPDLAHRRHQRAAAEHGYGHAGEGSGLQAADTSLTQATRHRRFARSSVSIA